MLYDRFDLTNNQESKKRFDPSFVLYGEDLEPISGAVHQSGEGRWTLQTADEMGVESRVIREAVSFRDASENNPSYAGKVVSTLRGQFGGHPVLAKQTVSDLG